MAEKMSSRLSCGYSARSSSIVRPSANISRTNDTHIRVPLMHGLPKQMLGLTDIRSNSSFIVHLVNSYVNCSSALNWSASACKYCWLVGRFRRRSGDPGLTGVLIGAFLHRFLPERT